jgi:hypothetical protein
MSIRTLCRHAAAGLHVMRRRTVSTSSTCTPIATVDAFCLQVRIRSRRSCMPSPALRALLLNFYIHYFSAL